ncbi:hypothetical protein PENSPDRAFT_605479 [Peniophora sp. CONT]|nr:hypothetical protein PENSPDRAFT_605479 [Peniophora sp. CONT]
MAPYWHCVTCTADTVCLSNIRNDPFTIENLLPGGSLIFPVQNVPEYWTARDDRWHDSRHINLANHLASQSDELSWLHLKYLDKYDFLRVQCRLGLSGESLYLRVFLVPFDLPNVQGRLQTRRRDPAILKDACRYLKVVLPQLLQGRSEWDANESSPSRSKPKTFLDTNLDMRTMADIYADLEFPTLPSNPDSSSSLEKLASHILSGNGTEDLTSSLYPYQQETVAAMLLREQTGVTIPDPLYIPVTGIDGTQFYLQPSTMELLRERPLVSRSRGGILCEELGTGKTVMVLALILATMDDLPEPEQTIYTPDILTPVAFRHFRDTEYRAARERARWKKTTGEFPTLVETLHHYLRASPDRAYSLRNTLAESNPALYQSVERNAPYYLHYNDEVERMRSSRGGKRISSPRVVYLTSATLVVVPPNLVAQWVSEIHKHVSADIRVLVIRRDDEIPPALSLATQYDIILTSHTRLAKERDGFDVEKLHTWTLCNCTSPVGVPRAPVCTCPPPKGVSALVQIRWKRLVVDEGHGQGVPDTSFSAVCAKLNVERRWIMSGTPTRTLLGLNLGSTSADDLQLLYPDTEENTPATSPASQLQQLSGEAVSNSNGQASTSDFLPTMDAQSSETPASISSAHVFRKIWDKNAREDLRRLHIMMSNFLRDPRFLADSGIFKSHVLQALFTSDGPLPGAIRVLEQLMASVMIRHRVEDVEKDIVLPSLDEETVVLEMDPLVRTSYNAMLAAITFNAIDSERTDKDYMFHSANVASVREAIGNMSQLMFWRVDENMYNVEDLARTCEQTLQRAEKRNASRQDMELLKQAVLHVQQAVKDEVWRAVQTQAIPEMPYTVDGIPQSVFSTWAEVKPAITTLPHNIARGMMFPYRLSKLTEIVSTRPLMSMPHLAEEGVAQEREDRLRLQIFQAQVATRKKTKGHKADDRGAVKAHLNALAAEAPARLLELHRAREAAREAMFGQEEADADAQTMAATSANASSAAHRDLLRRSALGGARILHSRSAKLNYILNEVAKYSRDDKFLIFSKSPLTLAHIMDALNLARVKFISFTNDLQLETRQQSVTTFETSDTFRVFLMELKLGSHGLNLVSASRVIFCEPVWRADTEAQAIKRVHRIGQKKPITVKTLVMRGTPEELVVSRRTELKAKNLSQSNDSADDVGIRDFIERPRFLPDSTYKPEDVNLPLLDLGDIEDYTAEAGEIQPSTTLTDIQASSSGSRIGLMFSEPIESSGASYSDNHPGDSRVLHIGRKHAGDVLPPDDESPPKKRRVMFA